MSRFGSPRLKRFRGEPTYLLIDDFSVHKVVNCVDAIKSCGAEVDFVTSGYTSQLQVLNVGVNKPFKGYVQAAWMNFMVQNIENEKFKRYNVAQWVEDAWAQVTVFSITNTWASIGYKAGSLSL